ncbi:hypothetical protein CEXT_155841 [Caerostris extrusa]|uniref:Uncharacterized protein n=1 Tax=Caerostris extrusa TaxID=172846 RepID=A0AAV4RIP4_CAEEX|nr:hypothetical protein CEXT_155841 [Caerostris extrusa]
MEKNEPIRPEVIRSRSVSTALCAFPVLHEGQGNPICVCPPPHPVLFLVYSFVAATDQPLTDNLWVVRVRIDFK